MKEISLTKGRVAIVDDCYFEYLSRFKWYVSSRGYAVRKPWCAGAKKSPRSIYMHRVVLGDDDGRSIVDHINGNTLDNRRENLRLCCQSQNQANRKRNKNNTSGVRGVVRCGSGWRAQIRVNRRMKHLGCFKTIQGAAEAYRNFAQKTWGEFLRIA